MATHLEVAVLEFGSYLCGMRERSPTVLGDGIMLLAEDGLYRAIAVAALHEVAPDGRGWTRVAGTVSRSLPRAYVPQAAELAESTKRRLWQVAERAGHLLVLQAARELAACCEHAGNLDELRRGCVAAGRRETALSMLAQGGLSRSICRLMGECRWTRARMVDVLAQAILDGSFRGGQPDWGTMPDESPEDPHLRAFARRIADLIILEAWKEFAARLQALAR